MKRLIRLQPALVVLCLALPVAAGEPTVEWAFSDAARDLTRTPTSGWLEDGSLIVLDPALPADERSFERLSWPSGRRSDLVDGGKAREALAAAAGDAVVEEGLSWPDAFDPHGASALWIVDGDLFLMEMPSAKVHRLTETAAEERAVRYAPDGKRLAFVRDNELWAVELPDGEPRRLTWDGSATLLNGTVSWVYWEEIFGREDLGYWWSPDGSAIAYLQSDESGVGEMLYLDYEPAIPLVIRQRYPKTGSANPRVRVGIVDVAGDAEQRPTTWVDLGTFPHEYIARVQWLPDGERLSVQTLDRSQTKLDLFFADPTDGSAKHIFRESDPGWVNLHDDLHFLESGEGFLWVSERDGYAHVYRYAMDGSLVGRITDGAWALRSSGSGPFWVRRAVSHVDEQGGWLYYTSLEEDPTEKHLYRIRMDGSGKERLTEPGLTHGIRFDPTGTFYIDAASALGRAPGVTVHRTDGKRVGVLAEPNIEGLAAHGFRAPERLTIATEDGFEMPATLLKPRDFKRNKRYPVIFYVYGGPSAPTVANAWNGRLAWWEQILADAGFVVMRVDNRSATAQSKQLENLIINEGYGESELGDLLDAVDWVKAQRWADPERVGIWGWSGGGSFTLLAMTQSEAFRAGIAVAAVTDWRYYDTKWAEAFMKRPIDNPEGYEKTAHAAHAANLHGRLFLVHGTFDDNVHPQNAWRFADELIEAGILFDMMIYPKRKHGISDDEARRHLYRSMLEFWKREMGTAP